VSVTDDPRPDRPPPAPGYTWQVATGRDTGRRQRARGALGLAGRLRGAVSEALAFEARARRRVAPLVAEARAWLGRTDPGDPARAAAEAAFREYAALLIRIDVRLADYRAGPAERRSRPHAPRRGSYNGAEVSS
jgi:hypothetical protein